METVLLVTMTAFGVLCFIEMRKTRRQGSDIRSGRNVIQEGSITLEELVSHFYKHDDEIVEIRRYVKLKHEDLMGGCQVAVYENKTREDLLTHLEEADRYETDARRVIADGELEMGEMQKMLFFASFLVAKQRVLSYYYENKYDRDLGKDIAALRDQHQPSE